ncbi:MAG TPA: ABC transporter substrate-binding protein [Candidatus Limnocylindria bacterium]
MTHSIRVSAATPARAGLLALLVVVAGCAPSVPVASASPSPTAVPTGGALRVVQASDITTLDPWSSHDAATDLVLRQIYEPLVDLEPGTFRIVPKLAARWAISGDGRTYTFTLRSGVRFQDGTPLDAGAVVASFERGRTLGRLAAFPDLSASAADASTVVFTLRAAYAPFLAAVAAPRFAIVSPGCVAHDGSWATAAFSCEAGTGPFHAEPTTWRPGSITLVRNAGYWGRDADGHPLPYLDTVTFQSMADDAARGAAVHNAVADVALDLGPAAIPAVRADPNIAILRRPSADTSFLGFNVIAPPLSSADVRKAIAMAIDRGAIAQTVFGGDAKVASQLVPPGFIGYDGTITEFARYDSAFAKNLLAGAGEGAGFATELWYPATPSPTLPDPRRVAQAIAADLAKVGITAALHAYDDAPNGAMPLWIQARTALWADADAFLSDVSGDGVVQALLDRARSESDESKRAELYKQVTKLLQQQTARLPLFNATVPIAANKRVRGLVPQSIVGESFAPVWLGR